MLGIFGLLLMSFASLAQNYNIKGKITDSNGKPMIGATIVLKEQPSERQQMLLEITVLMPTQKLEIMNWSFVR